MKKLKSSLVNIFMSLTVICLVAGAALAAANKYTATAIEMSKVAALSAAVKRVAPEFDNDPVADKYFAGADSLTVYPALKDGQTVGYAVETFDKNGFSGMIRIMVGFDASGKLLNYSVLEHNETPGLGSKMQEWFSSDAGRRSVLGRDMTGNALTVTKDGGDVDAITAATISSRAFLRAINLAYAAISGGGADGTSGATTKQ
ncbi:MAG: RnfABCDGE type electron transport complex subunit G [Tannerella sp.]|jgi:electron transport complex protein RnfG|nr:RnfABCDGE type electron transport complex subunit G [Tannerella sp.]